jgi:hypothetical protein
MRSSSISNRITWLGLRVLTLGIFATSALAGGGNVIPATANPQGYSLYKMAKATSFFNTGGQIYPDTPFQILYMWKDNLTFNVSPGTMLYVPVLYSDSTEPVIGRFPTDVNQRDQVLNYLFAQDQIGNQSMAIVVDDKQTALSPDYLVGVASVKLGDNDGIVRPSNRYIVVAAFLTPLNPGTHTVQIQAYSNGKALEDYFLAYPKFASYVPILFDAITQKYYWTASVTYTVIVK